MAGILRGVIESAKPNFATFIKYAKVELTPPSPRDIPAISSGLNSIVQSAKSGRWKNLTVREAWLNTLITAELLCWFYVGECIGKRHLVGYEIKV